MKAIVLAAGAGARMRPLTDERHKSLLPIGSSSILGRIVDGLTEIGIHEITVVTGYRFEEVRDFLAEHYPKIPFNFVHNSRFRETNNIVSLAMALEQLEIHSDIILIECDVLFHPRLLHRLRSSKRGNIALVDHYRPGMDGTVVSVENGIVTQVFPPHLQGEDFDYSDKFKTVNVYRFDGEFCRNRFRPLLSCYAREIDARAYYELVLGMLINLQSETVRAEIVDDSEWAEVDDPNDLAAARFVFEPNKRNEILSCSFGGHWNFDVLDFTFMRNMYFPTDAMMAAMRRALPQLVRSYGSAQKVLNQKLAYALFCREERVEILHGVSQAFPFLQDLFERRDVLLPTPTFGEFTRSFPNHTAYDDAAGIDVATLQTRVRDFDLVVFVNPNNPTGTVVSTDWLHSLAANHRETTFLVDESFGTFSNERSMVQRLEVEPLDNVLVMASLSKSWGVPGLRLGYLYSSNEPLLDQFRKKIPIWNLSSLAEFFLELFLKFRHEFSVSIERSIADREDFRSRLGACPAIGEVYPSGGNFLLVKLRCADPGCARMLVERLLASHRIFVKDVSEKFRERAAWLRFAVRTPSENERLLNAINECLASHVV